ncbi:MAG: adenylate/guanylate cyclase domain-containing protein, partial [Spirochaetales bacterium]
MKIRGKIILVVLPLIITPILFAGLLSGLLARNGITGLATHFLRFKVEQVVSYANGQWRLLEENDLTDDPTVVRAALNAIRSAAIGVIRSESELIFAVQEDGSAAFVTDPRVVDEVATYPPHDHTGWREFTLAGVSRVGYALPFAPLEWTIYVTDEAQAFYATTTRIIEQVGIVLAVAVLISTILLILFAQYLTKPLRSMVGVISGIISSSDLSRRVEVMYQDETGQLAHTFNLMTEQLEKAYDHIKRYALRAATSRLREQKTRTIFQRYVPNDVIEQVFANPEAMLVGEDRVVSILFSDIRSFTTISEKMAPDQLVESLNHYFTLMVDAVMEHGGTVDKYIGDAIMAIYGAPVKHENDAAASVESAFDMLDSLHDFNTWQTKRGLPGFKIGVGINYGVVTVGNIGTEKKLDYTVIGDSVNVASRLEGLTKRYDAQLVISESVKRKLPESAPSRLLDRVRVKGRKQGLAVYATTRNLEAKALDAW